MKYSKLRFLELVGVIVLLAGCSSKPAAKSPSPTPAAAQPNEQAGQSSLLPVDADDAVWGDADAPVTIMAFLDFECPFCRQAYPMLLELRAKYGPHQLRFVFKHYPLPVHRRGINAARAAQAVKDLGGSTAFFAYEHLLYDDKVDPSEFSPATLGAWAEKIGIPAAKFAVAYDSQTVRSEVWHDIQFGQALGLSAVPSFLINGLPIIGAEPRDHFESLIDSELKAAADARGQGIPARRIYDRRIQVNVKLIRTLDI